MLLSAMVIPSSAEATDIDEVCVFAYYPIVGQEAVFDIYEIPYTKPYGLLNDTANGNVLWYDETDGFYLKKGDRFKADHEYRIEVNLEADFPEYTFSVAQDPDSGEYFYATRAYINGMSAKTSPVGKNITDLTRLKTIKLSCTMPSQEELRCIDEVYIANVPVPMVGNSPGYAGIEFINGYAGDGYRFASLTDDSHLNGIGWYDITEKRYLLKIKERFVEGHEYEFRALLEADSSHCFLTDDGLPDVQSHVRGHSATSSMLNGYNAEKYLYVTYRFGKAVKSSDVIKNVTITDLVPPNVGSIPDYSVKLHGGSNYHVSSAMDEITHNGITWYADALGAPIKVNDPFGESETYLVDISLYCDNDAVFYTDEFGRPKVLATVNGRNALCYSDAERRLHVTFVFNSDEKYTCTVSGSITSFGDEEEDIRVTVCPDGYTNVLAETTVRGLTAPVNLELMEPGSYVVYVTKKNHKPARAGLIVNKDGGTVNIVMILSGDANTDGKVTLADVSLIMKNIARWEVELNTYAADVNDDGKLNLSDVSAVMKYIARWDIELK